MPCTLKRLVAGPEFEVCSLDCGRKIDFLFAWMEMTKSDKKKVWALLEKTANTGMISNGQKFKKVETGIWEFKSFQIRIPCALHPVRPRCMVLLHVFRKKKDDWKESDLERARADRDLVRDANFEE